MAQRTRTTPRRSASGGLKKATQFLDAAIVIDDEMPDASLSLLVNAGTAAADVTYGARLGAHPAREP
jgi:hypothetical protein